MSLDGPRASVPHADEREGVGRRGGARGAAGRASKERVQALGRPGAAADEEHGADEHADHVPEEPIRLDLEDELVAPRGPRASGHGALELRATPCPEIRPLDQHLRRVHQRQALLLR